jgi:4-alpha-glucanotransferase
LRSDNHPGTKKTPSAPGSGQAAWEELEDRIKRLLEIVVKLRTANAQLMKENQKLKLASGQKPSLPDTSEDDQWRIKYEEAVDDIRLLSDNLKRMQQLVEDLQESQA